MFLLIFYFFYDIMLIGGKNMISTRGRYALRVMIDIAENSDGKYVRLDEIAKRQEISEKYLESIVVLLTRANFLIGVRGKGGGYKLVKSADKYTVKDILEATEGSLSPVACLKDDSFNCPRQSFCKTLPLWKGLEKTVGDYLSSITLADLSTNADDFII